MLKNSQRFVFSMLIRISKRIFIGIAGILLKEITEEFAKNDEGIPKNISRNTESLIN